MASRPAEFCIAGNAVCYAESLTGVMSSIVVAGRSWMIRRVREMEVSVKQHEENWVHWRWSNGQVNGAKSDEGRF